MQTTYKRREQFLTDFQQEVEQAYHHECAILGKRPLFSLNLIAVQIVPDCLLLPLGLREYGYSAWNGILLGIELATLFETHQVRITEKGEIRLASPDLANLYGISGWTEKIVQPPDIEDEGDANEQLWRRLLRWRFEKYDDILKIAGEPLADFF